MNQPVYLKDVVTLAVEPKKCVACGACLEVCPHQVLELIDRKIAIADRDACMECGACQTNCPTGAITVEVGVGCAAAVINAALGRQSSACCCSLDTGSGKSSGRGGCC